ncbi:MAG: ABC transporter permease [Candidatus Tectomicrobia bacterium]|nr:ABC transporter permease [Candidatus Tectomicrobia bacterium]
MRNLFKIAFRNLLRYTRRSLLTISLITVGVIFVLVFVSVTGSFKEVIITQITDSFLGDLQIHRQGYVASIENLPLTLNLTPEEVSIIERRLQEDREVVAYSTRIRVGGMFSNFTETTNIRLNGVNPEQEFATCPLLISRIIQGNKDLTALQKGNILVPELLAQGLGINVGDTVVIVATNKDGSVNGKTFVVGGILESATGPGGRDGYIHLDDAMELLRIREKEASEIAVNVKSLEQVDRVAQVLQAKLAGEGEGVEKTRFEVHTWGKLSPFANLVNMIDIMTFFIRLMLIAIVLISILNVMIMAVYERVREIGTVAAIGTSPGKILSLFLIEGFFLGVVGTSVGVVLGLGIILTLYMVKIPFTFGLGGSYILAPTIPPLEVVTASLMVIVVSILASVQPAYKASRMEPIDALRHI